MDIRNAHAGHIGLSTTDRNTYHTSWPCVPHPPETTCAEAVQLANRQRGGRSLPAAQRTPAQQWSER